MTRLAILFFFLLAPVWVQGAAAVEPDEVLADAGLEERARKISAGLRCLVCQNQSIDDSDAPLARDLRILVRQRLQAGDSDAGVREYLVARYGDFILPKPPFGVSTWLLWLTPVVVLMAGGAAFLSSRRRSAGGATATLSDQEEEQLQRVLREHG